MKSLRLGRVFLFFYAVFVVWFLSDKISIAPPPETMASAAPKERLLMMKVTAYCPFDRQCVGRWTRYGRTATGRNARKTFDGVATDFGLLPPGTRIFIPGIGEKVVDDTGGAMRHSAEKGIYHIDLRMNSHKKAKEFGIRWKMVRILRPEA